MLYRSEFWAVDEKIEQVIIIDKFSRDVNAQMCEVTRGYRMRNENVRGSIGVSRG